MSIICFIFSLVIITELSINMILLAKKKKNQQHKNKQTNKSILLGICKLGMCKILGDTPLNVEVPGRFSHAKLGQSTPLLIKYLRKCSHFSP